MDQQPEYDQFKQAVLAQFDYALSMEVEKTPSYQTMIMIRDHLVDLGIRPTLADCVVAMANVGVDDVIFQDQEFMRTVTLRYAQMVKKLHDFSMDQFMGQTEDKVERFLDLIDGMSLNLLPNVQ